MSFIATFTLVVFAATYFWPAVGVAVWALAVAASRAAMGRHYVGDVVAGLLLGLVTTATVFKVALSQAVGDKAVRRDSGVRAGAGQLQRGARLDLGCAV